MGKLSKLKNVVKDKNRKNLLQILFESIHSGIIERELPVFYFYNLAHKKDSEDYRNFVGMKKRKNILDHFYVDHQEEFTDKIKFNHILTSENIPTPKILANSHNYTLTIDSEEYTLTDAEKLEKVITQLAERSSTQSIFIKPLDGSGGSHAFKIDRNSIDQNEINTIFELMATNNFIFQETIIQNDQMNEIYPYSINTLRVYTYLNQTTQEAEVILALLRVGSRGSVVDNESMFVAVDINDEWSLKGDAKSFLHNGGKSFSQHPDTGFVFDGFKIPYHNKIIETLKKAAPLLPRDYIGWDVGLAENGPIIIEANDRPHILMTQIMAGGFKGHPEFRKILKDYI